MDSLLQEINMLPGVLGCFVLDGKQQVAGNKMPPIFRESSVQSIADQLVRIVRMGSLAQLNFTDIEIKYNESLLLAYPLFKKALLTIICEPSTNKSLVTMTVGMLAKDMAASIAAGAQVASSPARQTATPKDTSPPSPLKETAIDAGLASILEQVKDALALAIGPIAGPIMKDSIELWARQAAPSPANLAGLAEIVCKEINDPDLEEEFMTELRKSVL